MICPRLNLRLASDTKAYLVTRAASRDRSMNSEVNAILRATMQAEPIELHLTHHQGLHLIGDGANHACFGAFSSHDQALAEAKRLIASMPPCSAELIERNDAQ